MNKTMAYTGGSKIIIKDYNSKQIIAEMDNISYQLDFLNKGSEARTATQRLASYETYSPDSITLQGLILNELIADLLYRDKKSKLITGIPQEELQITDDNGSLFLNFTPNQDVINYKKISDLKYERLGAAKIDLETGIVSGLEPNTNYNFLYYSNIETLTYSFEEKRSDYVSIEILNRGNINANGSTMYLKIPKASLSIRDGFNFEKISVAQATLNFNIIDNKLIVHYY